MLLTRTLAAAAVVVASLTACGGTSQTAPPAAPPEPPAAATAPAGGDGGDCPLEAADLTAATGLTWTMQRSIADHPLETVEGVTGDVCVFTSTDRPQLGGDPLVLRTDVVEGPDSTRMRDEFRRICTEYGGSVDAVASVDGGAKCTKAGQALEGQIAGDDRTVDVYVVTASKETTEELSPSFDKVLAAVGD